MEGYIGIGSGASSLGSRDFRLSISSVVGLRVLGLGGYGV